jgi:hypothetical protein
MQKHDDDAPSANYRRALQGLKRQAPDAQKQALVRHLRELEGRKVTFAERLKLIFERRWPEWRLPVYGLAFASVLSLVVTGGILLSTGKIDAPEVDDIEFEGSSAVVIESQSHPTTLIWLSDAEEPEDEGDAEDAQDDDDANEVEDL